MLYKPSFCCHCGEKIERSEWNIFSSRRFCDVCKEENKGFELLARLAVVAAFLLPLTVAGSFLRTGKQEEVQRVSLVQTNKKPSSSELKREAQSALQNPEAVDNKDVPGAAVLPRVREPEIGRRPKNLEITPEVEAFYCGAATKKGTACTRKVKIKGYCWQHSARAVSITAVKPAAGS